MKKLTILTVVVLAVVIALPLAGLVLRSGSEFGGADSGGQEAITEIDADYTPWFDLIWSQSETTNYVMFGFQGVLGAALLFSALGYYVGRTRGRAEATGEHSPVPAKVITTYVVIAMAALAVVPVLYYLVGYRPPSGEIIALFFALVGAIASGFLFFGLTFFIGRGKGRTQAAQAQASSASSEPRIQASAGVI
jgi:cobalt/nickel transport protein